MGKQNHLILGFTVEIGCDTRSGLYQSRRAKVISTPVLDKMFKKNYERKAIIFQINPEQVLEKST